LNEFVLVLDEPLYRLIKQQQSEMDDWKKLSKREKNRYFQDLRYENPDILKGKHYHDFDELMRLDLKKLKAVKVDFDASPFGSDNTENGLYKHFSGRKYYVGARGWVSRTNARFAFLTTEALMTEVVSAVFHKHVGKPLFCIDADNIPSIYPVQVPVIFDHRANKKRIGSLAKEILKENAEAEIIADMVKKMDRVTTFQGAKGRNDLKERDIYIILTYLNGEKYAELNVIGQWLRIPNIIELHYQDLINQSVGRNRGFRQSLTRDTKTLVVCTPPPRLWKFLRTLPESRVILEPESGSDRRALL
jgi:hypothetical protein